MTDKVNSFLVTDGKEIAIAISTYDHDPVDGFNSADKLVNYIYEYDRLKMFNGENIKFLTYVTNGSVKPYLDDLFRKYECREHLNDEDNIVYIQNDRLENPTGIAITKDNEWIEFEIDDAEGYWTCLYRPLQLEESKGKIYPYRMIPATKWEYDEVLDALDNQSFSNVGEFALHLMKTFKRQPHHHLWLTQCLRTSYVPACSFNNHSSQLSYVTLVDKIHTVFE